MPKGGGFIENYKIRALLDSGNKINIINKIMADNLGLAISPYKKISLINTNKGEVTIEGIIKNVPISIRVVTMV